MATAEQQYLRRFTRTERALHWTHALAFFVLLASGLALYLPQLIALVGRRPLVKEIHLYSAIAWLVALSAIIALGDRRSLRASLRELDLFDGDDRRWLLAKRVPQGKFNAGQKLNFLADRRVRRPLRRLRLPALVRRARHPLSLRQHAAAPRRFDVRLAGAARRSPLPGRHPPGDTACAPWDHGRSGQ